MNANNKILYLLPVLTFVGIGALLLAGVIRNEDNGLPSALIGQKAPELTLSSLYQYPVPSESDLNAPGLKIINYWASWCAPCRVEHPNLQQLADSGIPIIGVNYKDKPGNAVKFLTSMGNPFVKVGADPQGRTAIDWGVYGIPESFIIDGNGYLILRFAGPITHRVLKNTILPAINHIRTKPDG